MRNLADNFTGCILAGGLGTRLRESVSDRPKVLAEVAGEPFLNYILRQFASGGVRRCVLCTGYLGEMIEEQYGIEFAGMSLLYSREESALGTAGALSNALSIIDTDYIIVANGDSFFNIELKKTIEHYFNSNKRVMIALKSMNNVARYGRVVQDDSGLVTEFCEKDGKNVPGTINAGIYLMESQILKTIPCNKQVSLEKEVFPDLVKSQEVAGYITDNAFIDIGTPETYSLAQGMKEFN